MKYRDEDPLLNELISGSELNRLREESFQHGLAALRGAKKRRRTLRRGVLATLSLVIIWVTFSIWRFSSGSPSDLAVRDFPRPPSVPAVSEQPAVKVIDDAELFGLFPDKSIALVGSPGHQRLVFLDELVPN